ncbi:MAG: RasGAP domain-containing protein, partial [Planctomycetota bacterium]
TEIAPALLKRETPPMKVIGRIQELNGPLIAAALQVSEDLPGNGVNGRFTDPAFMLNAMASALEAAGSPLTPEQSKALEAVARTWMAADASRRQGYDEEAYALRRLYEEAELKGRFFDDSFVKLTAEQVTILSPETSRGRVRMDLFSSGLLYAALVRPIPFTDDDVLLDAYVRGAAGQFKLSAEEQTRAREVIADWLSDVPPDLMELETNALDLEGLVHVDRVNAWARQTLSLLKSLVAEFGEDEARRESARRNQVVVVPLKNPPQGD